METSNRSTSRNGINLWRYHMSLSLSLPLQYIWIRHGLDYSPSKITCACILDRIPMCLCSYSVDHMKQFSQDFMMSQCWCCEQCWVMHHKNGMTQMWLHFYVRRFFRSNLMAAKQECWVLPPKCNLVWLKSPIDVTLLVSCLGCLFTGNYCVPKCQHE